MIIRRRALASGMAALLGLVACSAPDTNPEGGAITSPSAPDGTSSASSPSSARPSTAPSSGEDQVVGTIMRFTAGSSVVEATITEDSATTRDFLSRLPMTQDFEDYHGQEKITYPEEPFDYTGSEGMAPRVGDLFSYKPWGNLGFFYDTDGLGHSDDLVRLGTTDDIDGVMELDGKRVTIDAVR